MRLDTLYLFAIASYSHQTLKGDSGEDPVLDIYVYEFLPQFLERILPILRSSKRYASLLYILVF